MDTTKIIKGVVNSGRYTVTAPIVKEDYGLYLQIEGVELPQTYEVDFSNSEHNGTSVTMIGNSDGVLIPHQFIDTGKDIFAFLYHVGANYGRTVYKFRIPNKVRPDRTNEQPTPEEQSVIDQAISALNTAVAQTAQDVISADASAQSAQDYAEQAESARDTAQTYANNAQASATSASQSATASASSASASAQSASEAQSASTNAETYALNSGNKAVESAQSATASATSATQAQGYANDASASAQSASGYASSAQTSAQTASSKAQDASQSASTASTKATESAQSASQALTYKTDAESAKTASQTAQGFAESARDSAQGYAEDAQGYAEDAQASAESISASASQIAQNTADIASLEEDRYKSYVTDSASGSIASFPDGADNIPLKSLIVNIDPVQDLHGQANPYPAGGGKNKLPITAVTSTVNGVTFTVDEDGIITTSGTATEKIVYIISQAGAVTYKAGESYILNGCPTGGSSSSYWLSIAGAISVDYGNEGAVWTPQTDISNYNTRIDVVSGTNMDGKVFKPMVRLASETDATFAPYENICPISGWDAVGVEQSGKNLFDSNFSDYTKPYDYYIKPIKLESGKRYVLKAELVGTAVTGTAFGITKKGNRYSEFNPYLVVATSGTVASLEFVVDGTFTSPKLIVYVSEQAKFDEIMSNYNITLEVKADQNSYEPYTGRSITINLGQTVYGGKLDVLSGELTVYPYYASYNGETLTGEWISDRDKYVSGTTPTIGAQVVNIGAQGVTVQLEPHEVESLYGVNNLWADSGDTEVEYRADTKLFIERLTAPDSADMIADANITSGKYFMVGNSLYKATANIANGSAIIVGTNCTRKLLSEALNEINV